MIKHQASLDVRDKQLMSLNESLSYDLDCAQLPLFADDIFSRHAGRFTHRPAGGTRPEQSAQRHLITLTQDSATHQDGNRVLQKAGFEPKVAMQVNDVFTLLSIASCGVNCSNVRSAGRSPAAVARQAVPGAHGAAMQRPASPRHSADYGWSHAGPPRSGRPRQLCGPFFAVETALTDATRPNLRGRF